MFKKILIILGIIVVFFVILVGFGLKTGFNKFVNEGYRPRKIVGSSMEPTLKNGMYLMTQRRDNRKGLNGEIKRGDIVTYSSTTKPGVDYIHRVIGLPNDKLLISQKGEVFINNQLFKEDYLSPGAKTNLWEGGFAEPEQLIVVPDKNYFVMGDNRGHANDSRVVGFIPKENIIEKYLFCYWYCK